jgi:hypothetical protein
VATGFGELLPVLTQQKRERGREKWGRGREREREREHKCASPNKEVN